MKHEQALKIAFDTFTTGEIEGDVTRVELMGLPVSQLGKHICAAQAFEDLSPDALREHIQDLADAILAAS
tara:strand:- start:282 stop:491 length:210 start_codon:yes stop_codon:yes gene_type:complete